MCHRSARSSRRFDMVVVTRWSFRRMEDSQPSHVQTLHNHCNTLWVLAWVSSFRTPLPSAPPSPYPHSCSLWDGGGGGIPVRCGMVGGRDEYVRPSLADSRGWKSPTHGRTDRCTACLPPLSPPPPPPHYFQTNIRNLDHSAQIIVVTYENKPGLVSTQD